MAKIKKNLRKFKSNWWWTFVIIYPCLLIGFSWLSTGFAQNRKGVPVDQIGAGNFVIGKEDAANSSDRFHNSSIDPWDQTKDPKITPADDTQRDTALESPSETVLRETGFKLACGSTEARDVELNCTSGADNYLIAVQVRVTSGGSMPTGYDYQFYCVSGVGLQNAWRLANNGDWGAGPPRLPGGHVCREVQP